MILTLSFVGLFAVPHGVQASGPGSGTRIFVGDTSSNQLSSAPITLAGNPSAVW
jgi:hypothetical protein